MVNADVFKTTIEEDLKKIQECKIDLLIFQRSNDNLCSENNKEIKKLTEEIANRELSLEENLSKSGERKIETTAGWCAYRAMPDKWNYDDKVLIVWAKGSEEFAERYIRVTEEIKKDVIKKDIAEGFLIEELPGITVTPQEPKFNYKLNGGL